METYGSRGWKRQISSRQIREMKKNMQKVPHIQKKSDEYHSKEEVTAEKLLTQVDEREQDSETPLYTEQESETRATKFKSIIQKIRFIFTK